MGEYIVQAAEWAIDINGNSLYQGCEEIVRCRDCKHYEPKDGTWLNCRFEIDGFVQWRYAEPDGFCKWSEKKEACE